MFNTNPGEFRYPGGATRALRLLSGLVCATSLVGFIWVLLDDLHKPEALVGLVFFGLPGAYLAWVILRGVLERRSSLSLDDVGLTIIAASGTRRLIRWTDVHAVHHVGRTLDQHLRLRVGPNGRVVRIYYQVEHAAEVLQEIVRRSHRAADAYSFPFTAHRPAPLRAMLLPLLLASPCFALSVVALVKGAATPFFVFGLFGGFMLFGGFVLVGELKIGAKQPSEISVSEAGLAVVTSAGGVERVCWNEITGLRLGFSDKQPYPPVLFVEEKGVPPLAIEVGWVDAIRLYGLVQRAWRTFSKGPGSL